MLIIKYVLLLGSAAFAQQPAQSFHNAPASASVLKSPIALSDTQAQKQGAALFLKNCASCHGTDAMGTGNIPALANGSALKAKDGELFWFITNGSPQNGMPPATQLTEQQRWQVIAYIKAFKAGKSSAPTPTAVAAKKNIAPMPRAPFADYRTEAPGKIHKILPKDLPQPFETTSSSNGPQVVARPAGAWPKVPPGFKVQLFAHDLNNPRLMRTAPNGDIFLAESNGGDIRVFRGMNADGSAKQTEIFMTGFERPYGIAFYPLGENPAWIYIADTEAIYRVKYHSGDLKATGAKEKIADLSSSDGGGHWTRAIEFSLDGKHLFVGVGSRSNVDDADHNEAEKNRADILVMSPTGTDQKVYASGIRNAGGGLTVDKKTGELWCSVNERDALGDNLVPDYITHVEENGFYGWPWWYIGAHQDPRHAGKHAELKNKVIVPDVLLQPHHASLQLAFYDGTQFPKEYAGDLFAAQHGSWNRSVRTGYDVIRIPFHGKNRPSGEYEDFMTGFVIDNDTVWGRPVGVTVASDGSLLISDDGSNSIWRVMHE